MAWRVFLLEIMGTVEGGINCGEIATAQRIGLLQICCRSDPVVLATSLPTCAIVIGGRSFQWLSVGAFPQ